MLLVQYGEQSADGRPSVLELGAGESARFGRDASQHGVRIVCADPAVPRVAGEIRAAEDHWQLTNFSETLSYLVENPEGAGEYVRVAPRRVGAPIPFEFARVVLPSRGPLQTFKVYAPAHTYQEVSPVAPLYGPSTVAAFSLDESATYFLVLVALCEPQLRDLSVSAVPTNRQVIERLRDHRAGRELTDTAVDFHIDYLARHKLRIRRPTAGGPRTTGRREAVVALALRFGLVREEHLGVLPGRQNAVREAAG
ncbi:serine/threonine protein kinase [Kitasatospora sp. NPDC096147]|uniref:serine/threonine protein kinase n=1 Tax=Kitasatospora sp. NPDC096147 TaxID=3364093 RepID=UPI00382F4F37